MSKQQFIEFANSRSLKLAQERARAFKIKETTIELWSHYYWILQEQDWANPPF